MRKTILYIAMSLDGYIADRDGGVAWLAGDGSSPDHPGSYPRFYESIDTVILGYATYRQIVTELFPDGWIYQGKTSYVLTHRRERPAGDVIFTDEEIDGLITRLKAAEGRGRHREPADRPTVNRPVSSDDYPDHSGERSASVRHARRGTAAAAGFHRDVQWHDGSGF